MAAILVLLSGLALLLSAPFGKSATGRKLRRSAAILFAFGILVAVLGAWLSTFTRNVGGNGELLVCLAIVSLLSYAVLETRRGRKKVPGEPRKYWRAKRVVGDEPERLPRFDRVEKDEE